MYHQPNQNLCCSECKGALVEMYHDGFLCCIECGLVSTDYHVQEHFLPSDIKQKLKISKNYKVVDNSYYRINHYKAVDRQLAGLSKVPPFVIEKVKNLYKTYQKPLSKASRVTTVLFLKHLGKKPECNYKKYYKHAAAINWSLSGKPPKVPVGELSENLVGMWRSCNGMWPNCPEEVKGRRRSFPPYVDFRKRCLLALGRPDLAKELRNCTTRIKIIEHNAIWTWFAQQHGFTGWFQDWQYGLIPVPPKKKVGRTAGKRGRPKRRRVRRN